MRHQHDVPQPGDPDHARIRFVRLGAICLTALFLGCEGSPPGGSEMAITVDPSSTTIAGIQAVVFTAASAVADEDLALPLEWSVTNAALGDFINDGGLSAVYQSTAQLGSNAITVRDQRGAEGVAVVYQEEVVEEEPEEAAGGEG